MISACEMVQSSPLDKSEPDQPAIHSAVPCSLCAQPGNLPYGYLTRGLDDRLVSVNRQHVADLSAHLVLYEYRENFGGHDRVY